MFFLVVSVYAFNSVWKRKRSFPMDMASFALNITLILKNKQAKFTYEIPRGKLLGRFQAYYKIIFLNIHSHF